MTLNDMISNGGPSILQPKSNWISSATLNSGGFVKTNGSVGHSGGTVTSAPNRMVSAQDYKTASNAITSRSPDLPSMFMVCEDISTGNMLKITVSPDRDITAFETMRITQLLFCYQINPELFNAFEFIKKNNLERHFQYA